MLAATRRLIRPAGAAPTDHNTASWAVKESAVLLGSIGVAREEPSLGVAIITTELALASFGLGPMRRAGSCCDGTTRLIILRVERFQFARAGAGGAAAGRKMNAPAYGL